MGPFGLLMTNVEYKLSVPANPSILKTTDDSFRAQRHLLVLGARLRKGWLTALFIWFLTRFYTRYIEEIPEYKVCYSYWFI